MNITPDSVNTAAFKKPQLWNEIELMKQVSRIIDAYNTIEYDRIPGDKIHFQAAYPDYIFDKTTQANVLNNPHKMICYDIVKKTDGSRGTTPHSSSTKPRPVLMETRNVIVNQGESDERSAVEEIYRKTYDVTYRFDCLAPTDSESMELIRIFERMMEIHARYMELGSHRWIYQGRRPSYFNRETQYRSRTCEFFAQIEEQWYTIEDKIEHININYLGLDIDTITGMFQGGVTADDVQ